MECLKNMIKYMVIICEKNRVRQSRQEEETDLGGGSDENDFIDNLDSLKNRARVTVDVNHLGPLKKLFGECVNEARNIGFFIKDILLMEKEECTNPRFINYLMEKQDFSIKKTFSVYDVKTNYEIEYYGEPFYNENDVRVRPVRRFKTTDGVIADPNESNQIVDDIRYHYDNWKKIELDRILKRSGIATVIGLTIITLVTSLSLGLKRSGSDAVRDAKHKQKKAEKLTPAEKRDVIPWTDMEEASGKGLIFIGDNLYLIIGGSLLYLYSRKNKK